jgi:hypothetical protein
MKRTTEKAAEEVMGIPHAYWDELLVEMDTLKTPVSYTHLTLPTTPYV